MVQFCTEFYVFWRHFIFKNKRKELAETCVEQSELSGRSGCLSPLSLRPLSGAEVRLSELLFGAERTNSSACAQSLYGQN
jgi:hypothetical protein